MPRGDGTGPMGQGPMTGRGFGGCQGYARNTTRMGMGYGRGFNRARCFRFSQQGSNDFVPTSPVLLEKEALLHEKNRLSAYLNDIEQALASLQEDTSK